MDGVNSILGSDISYGFGINTQHRLDMQPMSPLTLLAEVASKKLHSDPIVNFQGDGEIPSTSKNHPVPKQEKSITLSQALSMTDNNLLKLFCLSNSNEITRRFTYECKMLPKTCTHLCKSFGSERKAREQMKLHLQVHLKQLIDEYKSNSGKSELWLQVVNADNKKKESSTQQIRKRSVANQSVTKFVNQNLKTFCNASPRLQVARTPIILYTNQESNSSQPSSLTHQIDMKRKVEDKIKVKRSKVSNNYITSHYQHEDDDNNNSSSAAGTLSKILQLNPLEENTNDVSTSETLPYENDIMLYDVDQSDMEKKEPEKKEPLLNMVNVEENVEFTDETFHAQVLQIKNENLTESRDLEEHSEDEKEDSKNSKKPKGRAKFIGQSEADQEKALRLIDEMKSHTSMPLNKLECAICQPPRLFTAPSTLLSHYRSHAGIRPYECPICASLFTRQHSLKYHMLIHSNQTRFTCEDCDKKFRHPSHFREHRRRHTGESPFQCSDCSMSFKTRNTYKRHLRTRHAKMLTTKGAIVVLTESEIERQKRVQCRRQPLQLIEPSTLAKDDTRQGIDDTYSNQVDQTLTKVSINENIVPSNLRNIEMKQKRHFNSSKVTSNVINSKIINGQTTVVQVKKYEESNSLPKPVTTIKSSPLSYDKKELHDIDASFNNTWDNISPEEIITISPDDNNQLIATQTSNNLTIKEEKEEILLVKKPTKSYSRLHNSPGKSKLSEQQSHIKNMKDLNKQSEDSTVVLPVNGSLTEVSYPNEPLSLQYSDQVLLRERNNIVVQMPNFFKPKTNPIIVKNIPKKVVVQSPQQIILQPNQFLIPPKKSQYIVVGKSKPKDSTILFKTVSLSQVKEETINKQVINNVVINKRIIKGTNTDNTSKHFVQKIKPVLVTSSNISDNTTQSHIFSMGLTDENSQQNVYSNSQIDLMNISHKYEENSDYIISERTKDIPTISLNNCQVMLNSQNHISPQLAL